MKRLLLICGLVLLACQALIVNAQSLSVTYYHTDALGSVVAATDENGDLRWKKSYLAYGQAQVEIQFQIMPVKHYEMQKKRIEYLKATNLIERLNLIRPKGINLV